MPTFIDESGDTGHRPGAKPYFRVAAVWVPGRAEADGFRAAVQSLRGDLGLQAGYEFKYAETGRHPGRRQAFLAAAAAHQFRFIACGFDKTTARWRGAPKADFHYAAATYLAATLRTVYRAAEASLPAGRRLTEPVVVDDNRDGDYLAAFATAFRGLSSGRAGGGSVVGRPRFGDSAGDALLQLADMVCGAVGSHIDGDRTWYDLISPAGLAAGDDRGVSVFR